MRIHHQPRSTHRSAHHYSPPSASASSSTRKLRPPIRRLAITPIARPARHVSPQRPDKPDPHPTDPPPRSRTPAGSHSPNPTQSVSGTHFSVSDSRRYAPPNIRPSNKSAPSLSFGCITTPVTYPPPSITTFFHTYGSERTSPFTTDVTRDGSEHRRAQEFAKLTASDHVKTLDQVHEFGTKPYRFVPILFRSCSEIGSKIYQHPLPLTCPNARRKVWVNPSQYTTHPPIINHVFHLHLKPRLFPCFPPSHLITFLNRNRIRSPGCTLPSKSPSLQKLHPSRGPMPHPRRPLQRSPRVPHILLSAPALLPGPTPPSTAAASCRRHRAFSPAQQNLIYARTGRRRRLPLEQYATSSWIPLNDATHTKTIPNSSGVLSIAPDPSNANATSTKPSANTPPSGPENAAISTPPTQARHLGPHQPPLQTRRKRRRPRRRRQRLQVDPNIGVILFPSAPTTTASGKAPTPATPGTKSTTFPNATAAQRSHLRPLRQILRYRKQRPRKPFTSASTPPPVQTSTAPPTAGTTCRPPVPNETTPA